MAAANSELAGQVALVTGAGRGVGRHIALRLVESGMSVMLAARSAVELGSVASEVAAAGGRARIFAGDVSAPATASQLVEETERELGPIDLLINNAGVASADVLFWEADADASWRAIEIDLRGPMLCAHAVLRGMVARRRGRIVNVTSRAGARPSPVLAYSVATSALFRLTDNLAHQTQPHGVLTIAISPGLVHTRLAEQLDTAAGVTRAAGDWTSPDEAAALVLRIARGELDALGGRFVHIGDDVDGMISRADEIQRDGLHQLRLVKLDRELEPLGAYRR